MKVNWNHAEATSTDDKTSSNLVVGQKKNIFVLKLFNDIILQVVQIPHIHLLRIYKAHRHLLQSQSVHVSSFHPPVLWVICLFLYYIGFQQLTVKFAGSNSLGLHGFPSRLPKNSFRPFVSVISFIQPMPVAHDHSGDLSVDWPIINSFSFQLYSLFTRLLHI